MSATVYDKESVQNKPANVQDALTYLNEFLAYDGYEVVQHGKSYDVVDKTRGEILVDVKLEPSHLSHAFIMEQIEKCRSKMGQGDYDGAITNARSLVEAVLAAIEKECDANPPPYDGDLPKLYRGVQKHLNLSPENLSCARSLDWPHDFLCHKNVIVIVTNRSKRLLKGDEKGVSSLSPFITNC